MDEQTSSKPRSSPKKLTKHIEQFGFFNNGIHTEQKEDFKGQYTPTKEHGVELFAGKDREGSLSFEPVDIIPAGAISINIESTEKTENSDNRRNCCCVMS